LKKEEKVEEDLLDLKYDAAGLIPAVIQDIRTGAVLMVAYMNRQSLATTMETGFTHFWSRSRQQFWKKGETSGHVQKVCSIRSDCDRDTLLVEVEQTGPACHTNSYSCFFNVLQEADTAAGGPAVLSSLADVIGQRLRERPDGSYVSSLAAEGREKIEAKVVEEAGEVVEASSRSAREDLTSEVADLWFHTLVLMGWHDVEPAGVYGELARRARERGRKDA
jgi:phosphoribosyl-ATP pyrophosphohydrolase/phosphoribosyl-AMP cyclohydrolase